MEWKGLRVGELVGAWNPERCVCTPVSTRDPFSSSCPNSLPNRRCRSRVKSRDLA